MGMFTYVEVDDRFMPKKYAGTDNWQTKELVEPMMKTLRIYESGEVFLDNEKLVKTAMFNFYKYFNETDTVAVIECVIKNGYAMYCKEVPVYDD